METRRVPPIITTVPPESREQLIRANSGFFPPEDGTRKAHADAETIDYLLNSFRTRQTDAVDTFTGLISEIAPAQNVVVHNDNIWPAYKNHPLLESLIVQNKDESLSFYIPFYDRTIELQYSQESLEHLIMKSSVLLRILVQIAFREHELEMRSRIQTENFMALVHDLRNKMSVAFTNAELLLDGNVETRALEPEPLEDIHTSLESATRMLDHSVAFFANQLNGLSLNLQPINVKGLISKLTLGFRKRCKVRYFPTTSRVDVDPVHLERVLDNLIQNALKFSDAATAVEVETYEDGSFFIIEIKDHGCGLGEDPERLFNYFEQGKGRGGKGGYGIGLGYCKMICERFGGTIEGKNNEDGEGATFTIKLPISPSEKA